uniref:Uncharacterized protein n=1 Tax=Sphaerodactylus townsendi TaxID=933632 RepID=A0ACB8G0H6_9SAUR
MSMNFSRTKMTFVIFEEATLASLCFFLLTLSLFKKKGKNRIQLSLVPLCLYIPDSPLAASIPKNKHLHSFERPSVLYCHRCLFLLLFPTPGLLQGSDCVPYAGYHGSH